MLNAFEMYDLYAILVNIRQLPTYCFNSRIVSAVLNVLKERDYVNKSNQIRYALKKLDLIDEPLYHFVSCRNYYPYVPFYIKCDNTYQVLVQGLLALKVAIDNKNFEKVEALAEALHNLPILIVDNKGTIPKSFYKRNIAHYRKKWDKSFLA